MAEGKVTTSYEGIFYGDIEVIKFDKPTLMALFDKKFSNKDLADLFGVTENVINKRMYRMKLKRESESRGRKAKEFDLKQIEAFLAAQGTLKEIAAYMDCSAPTLKTYIKAKTGLDWSDYRDQAQAKGRLTLRGRIFTNKSSTVDMFLAKNYLGLSDKPVEKIEENVEFDLGFDALEVSVPQYLLEKNEADDE